MRIWIDKAGKAERKEKGRRRERRNNLDGTKLVVCLLGRSRAGLGETMLGGLRLTKDGQDIYRLPKLAPSGGARGWKYLKTFG